MGLVGWRKLTTQLLLTLVALSSEVHSAPAPEPDCSSVLLGLAACLDFVSPGSKMTEPKDECCPGLGSVLSPADNTVAVNCLCDAIKSAGTEYGVPLNLTRALALPATCNITNFNSNQCQIGPATAPVPAYSPPATSPNTSVPTPSSGTGADEAPSTQAPSGPSSSSPLITTTTTAVLLVLSGITAVFLD